MSEEHNPASAGHDSEGRPQATPGIPPDRPAQEPTAADPTVPAPAAPPAGSPEPAGSDASNATTAPQPAVGSGSASWTAPVPPAWQQQGWHPQGYPQQGYQQHGYPQQGYPQGAHQQPGYAGTGWQQQAGPGTGWAQGDPAFGTSAGGQPAGEPTAARSGRWRLGVAGLVAGALIGGGAGAGVVALVDSPGTQIAGSGAPAQNVVIKDPQNATSATAAAGKAAPSVVTIYVTNGQGAGSGSGVVLTSDGYVLTNNHVVTLEGSGSGTVQVRTSGGAMFDADVVGTDASADLAVVKLKGASGLTPATFADSDKVQVGDLSVAIGAPLGLSNTVTNGIISATNRAVETGSTQNDATVIDALQTDAAINPGNSGGALVNASGEVVGINTAIASVASESSFGGQDSQSGNIGVGFAIPSNTAKRIADEIMKTGKATHAVLGVTARTASTSGNPEAGDGAQIVQVTAGGPAADAGLQAGDVVTAVGDRVVTTSTELTAAIRSSSPGSKVTLTVRRGNSTQKIAVTLDSTS